jgi:hypothetical protein
MVLSMFCSPGGPFDSVGTDGGPGSGLLVPHYSESLFAEPVTPRKWFMLLIVIGIVGLFAELRIRGDRRQLLSPACGVFPSPMHHIHSPGYCPTYFSIET